MPAQQRAGRHNASEFACAFLPWASAALRQPWLLAKQSRCDPPAALRPAPHPELLGESQYYTTPAHQAYHGGGEFAAHGGVVEGRLGGLAQHRRRVREGRGARPPEVAQKCRSKMFHNQSFASITTSRGRPLVLRFLAASALLRECVRTISGRPISLRGAERAFPSVRLGQKRHVLTAEPSCGQYFRVKKQSHTY